MMRFSALQPTYTEQTLLAASRYQAVSAVACRRSGQDGTQTRGNLMNGTQTNPQVLSSFMREAIEDEASVQYQAPLPTNGCNKKTLGTEEPSCRKSFLA